MSQLTATEEKIMEILWEKKIPMSVPDIANELPTVTDTTIHRCMKSLEKQGLVEITDFKLIATRYTRVFSPTVSSSEFLIQETQQYIEKHDINVMDFISSLIGKNISPELIATLEERIRCERDKNLSK